MFLSFARRFMVLAASLIAAVALLATGAGAAAAATFTVGSTADSAVNLASPCPAGTCTLRGAVIAADEAGGSSTIDVPGNLGTYELTIPASAGDTAMPYQSTATATDDPQSGDLDIDNDASITIVDSSPSAPIVIDGSTSGYDDRAFHVHAGASLTLDDATLESFAAVGGPDDSTEGGAIYDEGTLGLSDVTLLDNTGISCGGIDVSGALQLSGGVSFEHNQADDSGGALCFESGAAAEQLDGASFSGNSAATGGAIYADADQVLTLDHDSFDGDSSSAPGAAAYVAGGLTAISDTFTDETNSATGGALYVQQTAPIDIEGSIFDGDTSPGSGGAILVEPSSGTDTEPTTISDSSFEDDRSTGAEGGAICLDEVGPVDISATDFSGDQSDAPGGAIFATNTGTLSVTGSTFSDDSASAGYGGAVSTGQLNTSYSADAFLGDSAPMGGAIAKSGGDMAVSGSAFHDDTATAGPGGALFDDGSDSLALTSDTFDSNTAANPGGAIAILEAPATGQAVTLLNDTIARNTTTGTGGGVYGLDSATSVENTIIADDSPNDCDADVGSADRGANLDGDGSCFGTGTTPDAPEAGGDLIDTDPELAAFSNGSGTDIPLAGSPALGAGIASACPEIDGVRAAVCNIGAYQSTADGLSVMAAGASTAGTVGQPLALTFTVVNAGAGDAHGVSFADTLPAGLSYYASTTSQGSCKGGATVSCSLGTVAGTAGGTPGTATVTVTVVPSVAGTFADTAGVSGDEADPSPATTATITAQVSAQAKSNQPGSSVLAPLVLTTPASHVKATSARLGALINPGGATTTYRFQYGRTKHYGQRTAARTLAGAVRSISVAIKRLKPGVTYHFRIEATNSAGTTYGRNMTFRTARAKARKHETKHRSKRSRRQRRTAL